MSICKKYATDDRAFLIWISAEVVEILPHPSVAQQYNLNDSESSEKLDSHIA